MISFSIITNIKNHFYINNRVIILIYFFKKFNEYLLNICLVTGPKEDAGDTSQSWWHYHFMVLQSQVNKTCWWKMLPRREPCASKSLQKGLWPGREGWRHCQGRYEGQLGASACNRKHDPDQRGFVCWGPVMNEMEKNTGVQENWSRRERVRWWEVNCDHLLAPNVLVYTCPLLVPLTHFNGHPDAYCIKWHWGSQSQWSPQHLSQLQRRMVDQFPPTLNTHCFSALWPLSLAPPLNPIAHFSKPSSRHQMSATSTARCSYSPSRLETA